MGDGIALWKKKISHPQEYEKSAHQKKIIYTSLARILTVKLKRHIICAGQISRDGAVFPKMVKMRRPKCAILG